MKDHRWIEEILPFLQFLGVKSKLEARSNADEILTRPEYSEYSSLEASALLQRIEEEHRRGALIDDKTFKLTLSLSIGLAVLGSASALILKALASQEMKILVGSLLTVGVAYVLTAGFLALTSLRTLPSYGFGTTFLLQRKADDESEIVATALARQETSNLLRHARNEAAYMTLRNGFLLLFVACVLFVCALAYQASQPASLIGDKRATECVEAGPNTVERKESTMTEGDQVFRVLEWTFCEE